jgi:GNAT superfamily N-acetyltransferase
MIEIREMDENYIFDNCPLYAPFDPSDSHEESYPGCGKRAREIRRRFFKEVRDQYGNCVLFAWDDEKIVGFLIFLPKIVAKKIGLKILPHDELTTETLVYVCMQIVPEYQRKGIGTKLVESLIAWAKDNGWKRIEVHGVAKGTDNEDWRWNWALPKWKKMGFNIAREKPSVSVVLDVQ